MGFIADILGLGKTDVEPLPATPVNPDVSATQQRRASAFSTGRRTFTSPLGDTSANPVRKTLLGE